MLLSLRAAGESIPIRVHSRLGIASPTARNDKGTGQSHAFPTLTRLPWICLAQVRADEHDQCKPPWFGVERLLESDSVRYSEDRRLARLRSKCSEDSVTLPRLDYRQYGGWTTRSAGGLPAI